MKVKIERDCYEFIVDWDRCEDYKDIQPILMKLYNENKNHPVFEDYVKTGYFTFFIINKVTD